MSLKEIKEIKIVSNSEIISEHQSSLLEYAKDAIVITIDEARVIANYEKLEEEMFEYRVAKGLEPNHRFMFSLNELKPKENIYINFLENISKNIKF